MFSKGFVSCCMRKKIMERQTNGDANGTVLHIFVMKGPNIMDCYASTLTDLGVNF